MNAARFRNAAPGEAAPDPLRRRTLRTGGRNVRMLVAATTGWLAGYLITLPMKISSLVGVAVGDDRLLVDYLIYGLLLWALITGAIAVSGVVIVLGPFAALVSARWVVRHPGAVAITLPGFVLLAISYRLGRWYGVSPGPFGFRGLLMIDYSIFLLVFSAVTSMMYLRLLRRGIRSIRNLPGASSGSGISP